MARHIGNLEKKTLLYGRVHVMLTTLKILVTTIETTLALRDLSHQRAMRAIRSY